MRVFVTGASGAVGRPLVRQLVEAGHEVTGMTRSEERADEIRGAGATAVVGDALDERTVSEAVGRARPEVVMNQMTQLPERWPRRLTRSTYEGTERVRGEGTRILLDAAREAGARRAIVQSVAFLYEPEGSTVKDESARTLVDPPAPFDRVGPATFAMERAVTGASGIEGLVLRYGWFYGPGTYFARDGSIGREVRKRRYPLVGDGGGIFSFVHVDDAAGAAVAACERGAAGLYNVVDDDPAPMREWLPAYAEALGAKPPRRVPFLLAALVAGRFVARMAIELRGAANEKAKRDLGWAPRYPSWREGFREALG